MNAPTDRSARTESGTKNTAWWKGLLVVEAVGDPEFARVIGVFGIGSSGNGACDLFGNGVTPPGSRMTD